MRDAVVGDGVLWAAGRAPWAVWADPPSLEPVLVGGRQSAVVSMWADFEELAGTGLVDEQVRGVLDAVSVDVSALGAPVRFLAASLDEETSRLAQAALWLGSALDQSHAWAPPAEAELATARAAAAEAGAALGDGRLRPASMHRLRWLWAALEWGGDVVEEPGATVRRSRVGQVTSHHAFLLGVVEDSRWPLPAEHLPFPLAWCVRRAPEIPAARPAWAAAAGIVAVGAESAEQLETRVEQLRAAYLSEGHELVRPREQLALAAAMAPWKGLPRRVWRRASRSLART